MAGVGVSRTEQIGNLVAAAARPCPTIVEAKRCLCKTTGKIYSVFGLPFGAKADDYEHIVVGHVYRSQDGSTYGMIYPDVDAAESAHALRVAKTADQFRTQLEQMTEAEFAEQVAYWLKQKEDD